MSSSEFKGRLKALINQHEINTVIVRVEADQAVLTRHNTCVFYRTDDLVEAIEILESHPHLITTEYFFRSIAMAFLRES